MILFDVPFFRWTMNCKCESSRRLVSPYHWIHFRYFDFYVKRLKWYKPWRTYYIQFSNSDIDVPRTDFCKINFNLIWIMRLKRRLKTKIDKESICHKPAHKPRSHGFIRIWMGHTNLLCHILIHFFIWWKCSKYFGIL